MEENKSRYEILAELWGVSVEEAKARDEARRAQVAAESAPAAENAPASPAPAVKKTDAAADKKS